jgi:hypothetical protein
MADEKLTPEAHKARHVLLHKALDELVADWINHHPQGTALQQTSIMTLIQWSHTQTVNPTERE